MGRGGRGWLARAVVLAVGILALALIIPVLFIGVRCVRLGVEPPRRDAGVERRAAGIQDYVRDGAATYLTVPEWYIVYSTEEYASWLRTRPPSEFPYLGASLQYWDYYGAMCDASRSLHSFDPGVHLMLGVIGVSFTAENGVKAIYENSAGRLTEWLGSHATPEDAFAQRTAAEYGRFVHTVPWYEFPFASKIAALWYETPLWGPAPIRKWERRAALTAEYAVRAGYAWLIRQGTGAVYDAEAARIHAWIDAPASAFIDARVRKVKDLPGGSSIITLPRFGAFTDSVRVLVADGARFHDIAGNDVIVLSATARGEAPLPVAAGDVLFTAPILTDPGAARIVVRTPVKSLHTALPALERAGARLEHIYDY